MATSTMLSQLPKLDDDDDIGVEKAHIVPRDDEPDLKFTGKLLGSAAPASAPRGRWREYRVYETTGGNYVFSKVGRSALDGERDKFEAEIYKVPATLVDVLNSSLAPQLIPTPRSSLASLLSTGTESSGWATSAIRFFGYDPVAKDLYRKLGIESERTVD